MYIEECGYHALDNVYAVKREHGNTEDRFAVAVAALSAK